MNLLRVSVARTLLHTLALAEKQVQQRLSGQGISTLLSSYPTTCRWKDARCLSGCKSKHPLWPRLTIPYCIGRTLQEKATRRPTWSRMTLKGQLCEKDRAKQSGGALWSHVASLQWSGREKSAEAEVPESHRLWSSRIHEARTNVPFVYGKSRKNVRDEGEAIWSW